MTDQKRPTQNIDRSRPEARAYDAQVPGSGIEFYTDGEFINAWCEVPARIQPTRVNNWIHVDALVAYLKEMGRI